MGYGGKWRGHREPGGGGAGSGPAPLRLLCASYPGPSSDPPKAVCLVNVALRSWSFVGKDKGNPGWDVQRRRL